MVTLENIEQFTIPFDQFELKWRFTEEKYNVLPATHLEQIQPLNKPASKMLNDLTNARFDKRFQLDPLQFKRIETVQIPKALEDERPIKKWLYRRGLPFEQQVYVSWDNDTAAITTWKMVVKYWSDLWYSDDLVVVDKSLTWALVFYHYYYVEFGTNRERHEEMPEGADAGSEIY